MTFDVCGSGSGDVQLVSYCPRSYSLKPYLFNAVWVRVQYDGFDHCIDVIWLYIHYPKLFIYEISVLKLFFKIHACVLHCKILEENAQHKHKCLYALA